MYGNGSVARGRGTRCSTGWQAGSTMIRIGSAVVAATMMLVAACSSSVDGDQSETGEVADVTSVASSLAAGGSIVESLPEPDPVESVAEQPSTSTALASDDSVANADDSTTVGPSAAREPVDIVDLEVVVYDVPSGSRPHDVAPADDGGVWYTAQRLGALGHLDPDSGETRHIALGDGSAPHGVIVGPDGFAWITDGGLNAIVSVDPATDAVTTYPLPANAPSANLNTAAFDEVGQLWFTGQSGFYGVLDPASATMEVFESPRGSGPYGITATPTGDIYFASLAGSYVGFVAEDRTVVEIEPPTPSQGARRVWSDSGGAIWVSEWNSGQLSSFDRSSGRWRVWPLPGSAPSAYAVYVDSVDHVWVSDFGGNSIHRFRPETETFETFNLPANPGNVRQLLGRDDEIWGAQSADDSLIVIRPA